MRQNPTTFRESYPCPYLPGRTFTQETFFAEGLNARDWGTFLSAGWRRFGTLFFRPVCRKCCECRPIRILAAELQPTASQKRVLRKNFGTRVLFTQRPPDRSTLDLYNEHASFRFGKKPISNFEFSMSFMENGVPALRSEYWVEDALAAVGFLDQSDRAFSSVYFVYAKRFSRLSLGTFSVFAESTEAVRRGLPYYHLGYWVKGNHFMDYKALFFPHEVMDWETGEWGRRERPT